MKKNTFTSLALIALMGAVSLVNANSTNLSGPGSPGGRPSVDIVGGANGQRIDYVNQREIGDCTAGVADTSTTTTSKPVSLTNTGMSRAAGTAVLNYAGNFKVYVVNTASSADLVVWGSMTPTAMTVSAPSGLLIKAGTGGVLNLQSRDGLTVQFAGVSGSAAFNYMICTQ